jgi:N-acetylmuramoyl-L-alanine amidase
MKVVIDAGHGGHDPGARGKRGQEKDIALSIALKLGAMITSECPDVEVIYTRKTDVFIELHKRAQIANQNQADLFISIHCNATRSTAPHGTETWVMGLHKSDENLEVARLENSAILKEDDYIAQYDGFDPNSPEAYIIFSMFQNAYIDNSLLLASHVQDHFRDGARRTDRGVKQAGFLVLYRTTMPGILVETGFISNPSEEQYLMSEAGQSEISSAILKAFKDYKNGVQIRKRPETDDSLLQGEAMPGNIGHTGSGIAMGSAQQAGTGGTENPAKETGVVYRIQLRTSAEKISTSDTYFKGRKDIREYYQDGMYKYTAGNTATFGEAVALQQQLRASGFKDAFVVAFNNGKRISVEEARKLSGN